MKDKLSIYVFRNLVGTFFVAFISMFISLLNYYQCSYSEVFQRIFFYDMYTTLYFFILWLFNYLVFEISKIVYDDYQQRLTWKPCILLLVLCMLAFVLPMLDLFQYNMSFLCLLIMLRVIKQCIKMRKK